MDDILNVARKCYFSYLSGKGNPYESLKEENFYGIVEFYEREFIKKKIKIEELEKDPTKKIVYDLLMLDSSKVDEINDCILGSSLFIGKNLNKTSNEMTTKFITKYFSKYNSEEKNIIYNNIMNKFRCVKIDESRLSILDEVKRCYRICVLGEWDETTIDEYNDKLSTQVIISRAKKYAHDYLFMDELTISKMVGKSKISNFSINKMRYDLLVLIDAENDDDKIREIIDKSNYLNNEVRLLSGKILYYINIAYSGKSIDFKLKKVKELEHKFIMFERKETLKISKTRKEQAKRLVEIRQRSNQNKTDELKTVSINTALELLSRDYPNLENFYKEKSIDYESFQQMIQLIEKEEPDLYSRYINYIFYNDNDETIKAEDKLINLITLISEGIIQEEDGSTRKFDMIDYYERTRLDFGNILDMAYKLHKNEKINSNQYRDLCDFVAKIRASKCYMTEESLLALSITYKNYKVNDLEKQEVINYLKKHKIPVNELSFMCAIKRYINGSLSILKNNTKVKKYTK